MPDLSTTLHVDMLKESKRKYSLPRRVIRSLAKGMRPRVYGTEWGDLDDVPPLKHTLEHWVLPYVKPEHLALEIGPGGGAGRVTSSGSQKSMKWIFMGSC